MVRLPSSPGRAQGEEKRHQMFIGRMVVGHKGRPFRPSLQCVGIAFINLVGNPRDEGIDLVRHLRIGRHVRPHSAEHRPQIVGDVPAADDENTILTQGGQRRADAPVPGGVAVGIDGELDNRDIGVRPAKV